ncbi:MAG: GerMN domain-containing protein [Bacilli bacterium]|jgi:germination protein M|nr:GerMN domain-containing protein [Bacilli bacterium]
MIKRVTIGKIALASIILILLFLFSIFPKGDKYILDLNKNLAIEYVNNAYPDQIYLIDANNYIARANVLLTAKTTEGKVREILEMLIIDGKKESSVPSGFRAIIPSDTKIVGIDITNEGIVKVNFSKALLDVKKELEEKIIEAITFSLTSLDGIKGVIIYVENELLTILPQSNKKLPPVLKRDFGINKVYNLKNIHNINDVTVYFINKHNENYYYVPVTKYVNDNRDKIKIIIDELTSGPIYETNLMSFLNNNVELLNYKLNSNIMELDFNSYIFDDITNKKILEEVIYSIALSIGDNYDVNEVIFLVNNEEIEKSVIHALE